MVQDAELKTCPPVVHTCYCYCYVHILSPSGEKLDQCTIFVYVTIENAADVVYEASAEGLGRGKREAE